jgi:hypothetical protein
MKLSYIYLPMSETMTIRDGKKYAGLIKKIRDAANASGRSLNNFVLFNLDNILKNSNVESTAQPIRGENDRKAD